MIVRELIERLQEYKPATEVYISTEQEDPISEAEDIRGIGEVRGFDEDVDGVYLLGF